MTTMSLCTSSFVDDVMFTHNGEYNEHRVSFRYCKMRATVTFPVLDSWNRSPRQDI